MVLLGAALFSAVLGALPQDGPGHPKIPDLVEGIRCGGGTPGEALLRTYRVYNIELDSVGALSQIADIYDPTQRWVPKGQVLKQPEGGEAEGWLQEARKARHRPDEELLASWLREAIITVSKCHRYTHTVQDKVYAAVNSLNHGQLLDTLRCLNSAPESEHLSELLRLCASEPLDPCAPHVREAMTMLAETLREHHTTKTGAGAIKEYYWRIKAPRKSQAAPSRNTTLNAFAYGVAYAAILLGCIFALFPIVWLAVRISEGASKPGMLVDDIDATVESKYAAIPRPIADPQGTIVSALESGQSTANTVIETISLAASSVGAASIAAMSSSSL